MNQIDNDIVFELKEKIFKILSFNNDLQEENNKLKIENKKLAENHKEKKEEIDKLEENNQKVRLAKSILSTSEDSHEAKLKINRIVREIDKCIGLLNK